MISVAAIFSVSLTMGIAILCKDYIKYRNELSLLTIRDYIKNCKNGRKVENKHIHDSIHKNNDVPVYLGCSGIPGFPVTHIFIEVNVIKSDINSYAIRMYYISYLMITIITCCHMYYINSRYIQQLQT